MAKSFYLQSYQLDPYLLSVRQSLHELGVWVEEKNKGHTVSDPILQAITTLGFQHAHLLQHSPSIPSSSSPLYHYFQFLHAYDYAHYEKARLSYSSLRTLLHWWKEGIDRYSSVLFIERREGDLSSLLASAQQSMPNAKETAVIHANLASLKAEGGVLEILDKVTTTYPSYTYARQLLAEEHLLRGDGEKALANFRIALQTAPNDFRLWLGLGDCFSLQSNFAMARCHYEECLRLFPSCTSGLFRVNQSYLQENNYHRASESIDRSLSIAPEDCKLLLQRAQLYRLEQKWREAARMYERVMATTTLDINTYLELAECYHKLGDIGESKRLLYLAARLDSQNQFAITVCFVNCAWI